MMNAPSPRLGLLDRLRAQHRTIRRNLDRLEAAGLALERGEPVANEELLRLLAFFRHFVQAEHEAIEEALLFPALEARCSPEQWKTVRGLEEEHAWGDALLGEMNTAKPESAARVIRTFSPIIRLHIERVEKQVFPVAETVLTHGELEVLGQVCDAVLAAASPRSGERRESECGADPWCLDADWQARREAVEN
jgi:hemerythrin-like domain-containing protein